MQVDNVDKVPAQFGLSRNAQRMLIICNLIKSVVVTGSSDLMSQDL